MELPGRTSKSRAILFVLVTTANVLLAPLPASPQENREPSAVQIPYILHVTTREVAIDVIAVDGHDRTVSDLAVNELRVSEKIGTSASIPESISSLRLIDPASTHPDDLPQNGFRIAANESCLQRHSIHYQLVYNPGPQALAEGNHEVHVKTSRRGVRLFYRHSYYVGVTAPAKTALSKTKAQMDRELWLSACSHLLLPPSISLRAARLSTGATDILRYKLNIESNSLAFVSLSNSGRGLQLDYGACNFNATGQPIGYMTATTDQVLTPVEYARAEAHGLSRILEFAPPADLAMTRFVVRDRATGNLGVADVVFTATPPVPAPGPAMPGAPINPLPPDVRLQRALASQETADFDHVSGYHSNADDPITSTEHHDPEARPLPGPVGSYGSVVPQPDTFCGDVFELQPGVRFLPDFRELDPIGSIYTSSLAVPYQDLPPQTGIPGVTDRIAWFGVDYHATFWISDPGRYEFKLMSDDGAKLQIDDRFIIEVDGLHTPKKGIGGIVLDSGRHTIHVPYFEGTPTGVALALWVRPPHGAWKIFDLHDYEEPPHKTP